MKPHFSSLAREFMVLAGLYHGLTYGTDQSFSISAWSLVLLRDRSEVPWGGGRRCLLRVSGSARTKAGGVRVLRPGFETLG